MMGDLQSLVPNQSGFLADYNPSASSLSPLLNPRPSEIAGEKWSLAETAAQGVIESIQATEVSENRRQAVIEYVQKLIQSCAQCEVFLFGSVPLKTYLPDGDIDLTAIGLPNSEDVLVSNVRHALESEARNNDAEFEVRDIQYIHAEVKLIKCLVQNIVVDISFNQTGGLSALCFLEHMDREIGKDHLFKRSIILIKAWCYYESRVLGARHGLISTYALETLVLYIFLLFHSSLDGPLAVLYRFLDYYSKFDWAKYCISLYGPVLVSSLPEIVAEAPGNDGGDLLFTKEFLKECVDNFSVSRGSESLSRKFLKKHLNIVDPLKENNNLGRSVSKGNFYRVRSAFTLGARKLGKILLSCHESIASESNIFFANILDRHGSGERPDVRDSLPNCTESSRAYQNGTDLQAADANGQLCEEMNAINLSGLEKGNGSKAPSEKNDLFNAKPCFAPHLFFHSKAESSTRLKTEQSQISHASESARFSGNSKLKNLADLGGDYLMHIRILHRAQRCQVRISANVVPYYPQVSSYQYQNNNSWDLPRHGPFSLMNTNGGATGPPFPTSGNYHPVMPPFISGACVIEDRPNSRGMGTYLPSTNYPAYKEQYSPRRRGRRFGPTNHFPRYHNNGRAEIPQDANLEERGTYKPPPRSQLPVFIKNERGRTTSWDASNSPRPSLKEPLSSNSFVFPPPEGEIKFGSVGSLPVGAPSSEPSRRLGFVSPRAQGSGLMIPASTLQRPPTGSNPERLTQGYQLKDGGDFPHLSG